MVRPTLSRPLLVSALCTLALGASIEADAAEAGYEMISYLDVPGGAALAAGDYPRAIEVSSRIARTGHIERRLAATTNLCVAYTVTRHLEEAAAACERAVTLAKHVDRRFSSGAARSDFETAKAMTNRGVLKVVSGDAAGAAKDLRAAAAMRHRSGAAVRNLERFEGSASERLAAADASD
ncbi:MAG TPA: hypothetical protein VIN61_10495 [Gammaproteobacteria bacterium]